MAYNSGVENFSLFVQDSPCGGPRRAGHSLGSVAVGRGSTRATNQREVATSGATPAGLSSPSHDERVAATIDFAVLPESICKSADRSAELRQHKTAEPKRVRMGVTTYIFRGWLLASFLTLYFNSAALAQSLISGSYAPFTATQLKAGIMPPPGTIVLENGSIFYDTREFVDSSGKRTRTSTNETFVNRTTIGYVVPDFKILGGDFHPAVMVMFMDQAIRPEPGSERNLQLADLIVQPFALGWHAGEWHTLVNYNLFLPTGKFREGASNNTGKGLYSHMLTGAVTWQEAAPLPWAATAQLRYEIFGEQRQSNIRPGQVMTIEFAAGKEVVKGFDLAITAVGSFQTTKESNSPPETDNSRYRFYGVGPEFHWRPESLPGAQVSVSTLYEFGARNTGEGAGGLLSLSYAF